MAQDIINLDAFKGGPSPAFKQALDATESLAEGIGQSYGVMGYKGKVWSLRHRGQTYTFLRPDDGSPANYVDVIILRQAHQKSKSYYQQYDQNTSEGSRPICSSINGIAPDLDVVQKQSEACAICPRNVWKVKPNGRNGRECTDYKRLAILLLPAQTARMFAGTALIEPVFLRVPPASLNSLAQMGEIMSGQGYAFSSYITRISFDAQKPHPEMIFRPIQKLSDGEAPTVLRLRDDPLSLRITGEDQWDGNVAPQVQHISQPALPPVQVQPAPQPTPQPAPAPDPVQAQPAPQPIVAAPIDTGLGGVLSGEVLLPPPPVEVTQHAAPAPQQPAPQQTAVDTGEPQESDAALDAHIDALLNPNKA